MGLEQQGCHGFADDVRAADDHCVLAAQVTAGVFEQPHAAAGRAGRQRIAPLAQAADVFAVKTVDVLARRDGLQDTGFFDVCRQRQLQEDAVDAVVCVQFGDQLEQLRLGGVSAQAVLQRADPGLFSAQDLVAHVDLTGRVLTHQNHCQRRLDAFEFQVLHVGFDVGEYAGGCGFAIDYFGSAHRKITVLSLLRKTRCSRWYFTAFDKATVSVSRPVATRSSGRYT